MRASLRSTPPYGVGRRRLNRAETASAGELQTAFGVPALTGPIPNISAAPRDEKIPTPCLTASFLAYLGWFDEPTIPRRMEVIVRAFAFLLPATLLLQPFWLLSTHSDEFKIWKRASRKSSM